MLRFFKLLAFLALVINSQASPRRYEYGVSHKPYAVTADDDYRLKTDVVPSNYKIDLTLNEDFNTTKTFEGTVDITFDVKVETKTFEIHMKNLQGVTKDTVSLTDPAGKAVPVTISSEPDPVTDFATITAESALTVQEGYILTISYTGKLSDTEMKGFYLSSYKDGETDKYLATTQFEEVGARRAFPCFDEPALKATFDVSITYPKAYTAWSNTDGSDPVPVKDDDTLVTVTFEKTPEMSTYLVAFIVAEFTCTDKGKEGEIQTHVCSRNATYDTRTVASETAPQTLAAMKEYTSVDYSLKKLTQAAIPDFAPGAMENWGMVTYREADLLWDDSESSNAYQQTVVTVITHELSHQWFGDLVTLDWWTNIFLNEGFATYFEYHAVNESYDKWELPKQFVVEQLQTALLTDSMDTSLPLSYNVSDPATISGRFDDISYNKGGSILRMVHHFLGLDKFKAGLSTYVNEVTGTPDLLWGELDANKPADITEALTKVMDSWTNKPGYPLLSVKVSGDNVTISQEPFALSGTDAKTIWYVPITYTLSNSTTDFTNTATKVWLKTNETLVLADILKDLDWIILNNQQTGYYRVNYDDTLWGKISTTLNSDVNKIDEISRSQIVDDLLNLARAGTKEYSDVLKLLGFLKKDDSYYSWHSAFLGFDHLLQRTVDENVKKLLINYIKDLMTTLIDKTPIDTVKTDDQIYSLKHVLANTWACKLDDETCLKYVKEKFTALTGDGKTIPAPNLRSIVYCYGLSQSDKPEDDYNTLWTRYTESDLATEKVTLLKALGCVNNSTVRQTYLATVFTEDVRIQDITYVFSSVYSNNAGGVDDVLTFIADKKGDFATRFGSNSTLINLISVVGNYITTQEQIDTLNDFGKTAGLDQDIKDAVTASAEVATTNLKETAKLETILKTYFNPTVDSASLNSFHFANIVFVLVGYLLFNFY